MLDFFAHYTSEFSHFSNKVSVTGEFFSVPVGFSTAQIYLTF